MTLLVLSVLLALVAGVWVIHPLLVRRWAMLADVAPSGVLDAEARKRVALASLREVEYDYRAGKLDEADYRAMRERLSAEAMRAIRAVDAVGAAPVAAGVPVETAAHACGFVNPGESRFCAGCGARLA